MKYDYLIVGAGLWGATFARMATDAGKRCLVIDKREHIAGNCYTKEMEGIQVHVYGPHIFHTDNEEIWSFVNRFAKFNHFTCRPKVRYGDRLYSFPINLFTLHQLWGVTTPEEAEERLRRERVPVERPANMKEWILSQVGEEIYRIFFEGYTRKQWGRDPSELPASIAKRLPIRLTHNDNYFEDRYQGVPIGGYTQMVEAMLDGIDVELGVDFLASAASWPDAVAKRTVYTGPIDRLFKYQLGRLEYRSLTFEHQVHMGDYQGVHGVNYPEPLYPFTRITEHKHFEFQQTEKTVITLEYPAQYEETGEPYYPVNNEENNARARQYRELAEANGFLVGGRLGQYQYLDMHQAIGSAMVAAKRELGPAEPKRRRFPHLPKIELVCVDHRAIE
jgi:UDP-galactopyranose mutase